MQDHGAMRGRRDRGARRRLPVIMGVAVLLVFSNAASAAPPTGYLDLAKSAGIGGWARDPDHTGPIMVHIYIDGKLAHDMLASGKRPDLPYKDKNHGYHWVPPPLGPGKHQVIVYGIGVNAAGKIDNQNVGLINSPKAISAGCAGLLKPADAWCAGVPNYYVKRAADTHYLYNSNIRIGINKSFGGTVLELYGAGHNRNLLAEHGGGAVQLSIWGYENKGGAAWFGQGSGVCDPKPYSTKAACQKKNKSCRLWGASKGAHVANCTSVKSCVGWGAGAPFNPIQAQAKNCGWDSATNDVTSSKVTSTGAFTIQKSDPYHFTKSNSMKGVVFHQTTTLHSAYVEVAYRITYKGPYTCGPHPQEIPAVFPGADMNHTYHFYKGATPYAKGKVTVVSKPAGGLMFRLKDRGPYPHSSVSHSLTENWVSACDASAKQCLTVAMFSPQYRELDAAKYPGDGYGYLTPLGGFAIKPGLDETFTVYLFPARHDQKVAGKTVRQWIYELAAKSKCLAHGYPCKNDGNVCTTNTCDGKGKCAAVFNSKPCDDKDPCTVADRCSKGKCVGQFKPGCKKPDGGLKADKGKPPDILVGDKAPPVIDDGHLVETAPDTSLSSDRNAGVGDIFSGAENGHDDGATEGGGDMTAGCGCQAGGDLSSPVPLLLLLLSVLVLLFSRQRSIHG